MSLKSVVHIPTQILPQEYKMMYFLLLYKQNKGSWV